MFSRFDRILACNRHTDGQTSCYVTVRAMHTCRAIKKRIGNCTKVLDWYHFEWHWVNWPNIQWHKALRGLSATAELLVSLVAHSHSTLFLPRSIYYRLVWNKLDTIATNSIDAVNSAQTIRYWTVLEKVDFHYYTPWQDRPKCGSVVNAAIFYLWQRRR